MRPKNDVFAPQTQSNALFFGCWNPEVLRLYGEGSYSKVCCVVGRLLQYIPLPFYTVKSLLCFERHGAAYFVARHYGSPTRVRVYPPTYIYEVTYDPRESIPKDYPTDDQLYAVLNEKLAYRDETFGVLV